MRIAGSLLFLLVAGCSPDPLYQSPAQIARDTKECERAGWSANLVTIRRGTAVRQYVVCAGVK